MKTKKVFLDLLFEYNKNGAGMTGAEMRDEINTFMFEVNTILQYKNVVFKIFKYFRV